MKKFFTLVAAAIAALTVNAELMTFPVGSTLGAGAEFKTANLTLTIAADDDSKFVIDANNCFFNPEAPIKIESRLKSGGKSTSKLALKLTAAESGTLKVYARTGSNSATDRNLVLTQNGTELFNHIFLESEAVSAPVEGESEPKSVYPVFEVVVAAGDIDVTFPVGSINFYGFELIAGEGPKGEEDQPLHFNNLKAEDFTNLVNCEATTYKMDGVDGPALNYTGADAAEMAFDCRGIHFTYKNSGTADNAVKTANDYIQLDKKNFVITVPGVKAGQTVNLYVSAKGSTVATFMVDETNLGTAAKANDLASFTVITYTAKADGDVKIKETTGGYRMSKIEITTAPVEKTKFQVEVPAGTWQCFIAGNMNNWGFSKMSKVDATHYEIELSNVKSDTVEYKFCAGDSWDYVETAADGKDIENRKYAEKDVVAAWKAMPKKTYKYQTIADRCNYIDFQTLEGVSGNLEADTLGGEGKGFELQNGTVLYNSAISSTKCSWKLKEDYNTTFPIYGATTGTAADTIIFGSQLTAASGAKIVLGEFEVGNDAAIEIFWQPNGTKAGEGRGVRIENIYDEENVAQDSIEFATDKNFCVITTLPIEKGYYDKEFVITVVKNTINIAGINIVGLKDSGDAVENTVFEVKAIKRMENGQMVIIRDGVRYNVMGAKL